MKVIFFNNKDDDNGVIRMVWMGPVAPALPIIAKSFTFTLMTLSKTSILVGIIYF